MLTEQNASEWKDAVVDKALVINAYHILIGMEMISSAGEDATARANFRGRQSQLTGNISSTLNVAHRALIKNANPKIAPHDAYAIWTFIVNHLKSKTTNSHLFVTQEMITLHKGSVGHEEETYSAYGACCINQGNIFISCHQVLQMPLRDLL